ncbi:MAG: hypothetical protein OEU26_32850 [Candidatus Tectomicrobia bacterium]|nr:hypothetical protein [Candidatus Tectomicrobia bacterium]
MRPPRALWVPFELGRPLGVPENAEFQHRVLRAALDLLQRPAGPILEDFPDDAPSGPEPEIPLACPVSFATDPSTLSDAEALLHAFQAEVDGLRNWYDVAVQRRGRTTANTTGMVPQGVADFLATLARGDEPDNPLPEVSLATTVKMASEDLKAYYNESVSAQPGRATDSLSLASWFWGETAAARVLNEIRKHFMSSDDRERQRLGTGLLVPRTQLYRFEDVAH